MKKIIAIDPGNKCGISVFDGTNVYTKLFDFTPKAKTKKSPEEPKHLRFGKIYKVLVQIKDSLFDGKEVVVVCEGAEGFQRGKSAVEVSHNYRGAIKCFCANYNINYVEVSPVDLKRFAVGKGKAEKSEMIEVAQKKYGYKGIDDNEADSIILAHWAKESIV